MEEVQVASAPPAEHKMDVDEVSNTPTTTIHPTTTQTDTTTDTPATSQTNSSEEERRTLEAERKAFEAEKKAFEQEKDQVAKDRRKLKKLIAFKQQVTLELAGFWKEKGRQGSGVDKTSAAVGVEGNSNDDDKEEDGSEAMTVDRMRDLLHKVLQREQELSETSLLLRGAVNGDDDEDEDGDDGDLYEDDENEDEDSDGVLVLDDAFSSSEERKGKDRKRKARRKDESEKGMGGEGAEAVGSLLDAASHQEKMEQLKAFKDQFGHCKVPWAWKENPQLGRWVSRMRSLKRNSKLDESTRSELEAMDFCWNPITENSTQWDEKLAQLKEFKNQYGHMKVPWGYKENPALGRWVGRIRQQRRDGRLLAERERELSSLGFVWAFGKRRHSKRSKKRKRKDAKDDGSKKEKKDKKDKKHKKKKKKHKKGEGLLSSGESENESEGEKQEKNEKSNKDDSQSSQPSAAFLDEADSGFAELTFASEEAAKIRSQMKDSPGDL